MIIREFQPLDFIQISTIRLREWDQIEAIAMTGMNPNRALELTILASSSVYVAEEDEQIHGVFGLNTMEPDVGVPWFVATDKAEQNKKLIMKTGRRLVQEWLDIRPVLSNYVSRYHSDSIKWLEWLGFTILRDTEVYFWSDDVPFWLFYRRA